MQTHFFTFTRKLQTQTLNDTLFVDVEDLDDIFYIGDHGFKVFQIKEGKVVTEDTDNASSLFVRWKDTRDSLQWHKDFSSVDSMLTQDLKKETERVLDLSVWEMLDEFMCCFTQKMTNSFRAECEKLEHAELVASEIAETRVNALLEIPEKTHLYFENLLSVWKESLAYSNGEVYRELELATWREEDAKRTEKQDQ